MAKVSPASQLQKRCQAIRLPFNNGDELLNVAAAIDAFPEYFGTYADFRSASQHFLHRQKTGWPALGFIPLTWTTRRIEEEPVQLFRLSEIAAAVGTGESVNIPRALNTSEAANATAKTLNKHAAAAATGLAPETITKLETLGLIVYRPERSPNTGRLQKVCTEPELLTAVTEWRKTRRDRWANNKPDHYTIDDRRLVTTETAMKMTAESRSTLLQWSESCPWIDRPIHKQPATVGRGYLWDEDDLKAILLAKRTAKQNEVKKSTRISLGKGRKLVHVAFETLRGWIDDGLLQVKPGPNNSQTVDIEALRRIASEQKKQSQSDGVIECRNGVVHRATLTGAARIVASETAGLTEANIYKKLLFATKGTQLLPEGKLPSRVVPVNGPTRKPQQISVLMADVFRYLQAAEDSRQSPLAGWLKAGEIVERWEFLLDNTRRVLIHSLLKHARETGQLVADSDWRLIDRTFYYRPDAVESWVQRTFGTDIPTATDQSPTEHTEGPANSPRLTDGNAAGASAAEMLPDRREGRSTTASGEQATEASRGPGRPRSRDRDMYIRRRARELQLIGQPAKLAQTLSTDSDFVCQFGEIKKEAVRSVLRRVFKRGQNS